MGWDSSNDTSAYMLIYERDYKTKLKLTIACEE